MAKTTFVDYYRVLKVSPTTDTEQIRSAYIKMAKHQHPDRGGSVRAMRRLNQAYETLRDSAKRQEYDNLYRKHRAGEVVVGDDFDLDEVDAFLYEAYREDQLRRWLNPFVVGLSIAGLTLLLFVVIAVGHAVTSSGSAQAAPAPVSQKARH